ncbi:hypothetical protein [Aquimarina sp. RZ0]|uniref:hypothetical protein n=1 Tax=Aquimarina sp. RZ0 TaxID=2607730 RepID=UPI0011F2E31E|nr:hypothetical protein [Aquimarina sp. RZ0]KAA1246675.1 hypothetical protein F0000_06435 [Aquimarina sp. RZ0]
MDLIFKTYSLDLLKLILIFSFSFSFTQKKEVRLIEDQQKKRTIIYIQNDSDIDKSVFLKINPLGYRRSAHRPIIKNIPANSKVQMIVLIPLTDAVSSYTYDLIVNDELKTIDLDRKKQTPTSSIKSDAQKRKDSSHKI